MDETRYRLVSERLAVWNGQQVWSWRCPIGGIQRPPNYLSRFARWLLEGFSQRCTFARSMEGVAWCHLDGRMETPHLHAASFGPVEKLLAVQVKRYMAVGRPRLLH